MKKEFIFRKLQRTYRNKMQSKKQNRMQTVEAGLVLLGNILLFLLSEPLQQETGKAYGIKGERGSTWSMPAAAIQHKLSEFE
ncbi:hypothetical protein [Bacillus sp. MMSF_3328]|uniref:hypothetical protein n=1 Tax=Bacillus sp. MMSF_3328 TaxID=3047080 RepID=UPI00273EAEB5|nr:hypothetical protein [Bacillus sp. MMSF_3328]